jgi:hypothetical protein
LKVLVVAFKNVEGFCFSLEDWRFLSLLLKRLKVFALAFECWRFLLFLLNVEGSCSYFWMLKVLICTFGWLRLLFLLLDVQSFYFWFWMLKVLALIVGYWRFLLMFLDVEGFCFWMYIKLCIQGKIFSKVPKIYLIVSLVFDSICKCTNYGLVCINVLYILLHVNGNIVIN